MKIKTILITILTTLFVVILLQNTKIVQFQILFWQIAMSRIIFLLLMFVISSFSGFITAKVIGKRKKVT